MRTAVALLLVACSPAAAGDWPQILGPNRDGVAVDEAALTALPADLDPRWTKPVGQGFAGPAVADGTVILFHRTTADDGEDVERLEALDAATGATRWTSDAPATYGGGFIPDAGPRCVPVVTPLLGGRVVAFGAAGVLRCVNVKDGSELWRRDAAEDYGADPGYFGFGSTPLVVSDGNGGGIVLCVVGGDRDGAGVVGFDLKTGKTRWTATDAQAAYTSPVLMPLRKEPEAVVPTRLTTYGIEVKTGRVKWNVPFGARGPTAVGANPVILPGLSLATPRSDRVFLTANYGVGATLLNRIAEKATVNYEGSDVLAAHYATPVAVASNLYGVDGRQDVGESDLVCLAPGRNERRWTERGFGHATLIGLPAGDGGGSLLVLKTDGELVLVAADPDRYRELGRARLFDSTVRALPAYSDGVLYARDENVLRAYQLSAQK
ncbi:outer membrane protein assembly factor BamB family protein [Alienimonas californiensis]|uniref:Outer membrane protein assembly factor BamB n=1 Tax=Alienimonas californiensis TaxID=2527989 RepID=A0A517PAW5_9PLAN|nr:PQQ-binding-like beta-propeller repeat protein [Alienimonas californiensis]QDT16523.1 Outer membrane protein assembly factor BamB [Alienimonas californiensis]